MAVNERSRHELFLRLEQIIGPEEATTLMEYLPPVGWADVATKRDLDHLENKLMAQFRAELNSQTRTMLFTMSSLMVTIAALAFTAASLT